MEKFNNDFHYYDGKMTW